MAEQPRITACENEYGSEFKGAGDEHYETNFTTYKIDRDTMARHNPPGLVGREFLSNGARRYPDLGSHIEYATPEDRSFWGTVKNQIAGEYLNTWMLDSMVEDPNHPITAYKLNRQIIDEQEHTYGYHENYCSPVDSKLFITEESLALLGLHMATRNIFLGEGYLKLVDEETTRFRFSQKAANSFKDAAVNATHEFKPIINLRNESHADPREYQRVHVTSGDANMSPWSMWMALGTTSIVLRLIEDGWDEIGISPQFSLVQIAKLVADDETFSKKVALDYRKAMTPRDIQQAIVDQAWLYKEENGLPAEESDILDEWQRTLDVHRQDPLTLEDRSSGIAKYVILQQLEDKLRTKGLTGTKLVRKLVGADQLWGEISDRGIGLKLRQTRWAQWMPSEEAIQRAIFEPPTTTRAFIRGNLIREHKLSSPPANAVSWKEISIAGMPYKFPDPYQTTIKPTAISQ